jgi:hypothetical protein
MPFIHDKTLTIGESQLDSFGHLNNALATWSSSSKRAGT